MSADYPPSKGRRTARPKTQESDSSTRAHLRHLVTTALERANDPPEFQQEIARGGVGSIAIARDHALQRRVAIKTLHRESYAEPMLVRGFLREALVTGQLDHPNIVAVHGIGRSRELGLYFSMGLVEGQSLDRLINENRELDYDRLLMYLDIISKVCLALSYAHSRGVLHCDIKPANIMVGEFGQVYIMDWGGACLITPHTRPLDDEGERANIERTPTLRVEDPLPKLPKTKTKIIFGTPNYMSPEQARGDELDGRSDVFAIGTVLYRIVMGRPPFAARNTQAAVKKAQRCEHPPLDTSAHGGILPRNLFTIIRKAMAEWPEDRYQSMDELNKALESLLRGGGSFPARMFDPDTIIIREGEPGDAAYIVLDGELEVYQTRDGKQQSLRMLRSGDVFGETAIFASVPRTASVITRSRVALARITADVITHELDNMKPWMAALVRVLAQRFYERESVSADAQPHHATDDHDKPWWKPW